MSQDVQAIPQQCRNGTRSPGEDEITECGNFDRATWVSLTTSTSCQKFGPIVLQNSNSRSSFQTVIGEVTAELFQTTNLLGQIVIRFFPYKGGQEMIAFLQSPIPPQGVLIFTTTINHFEDCQLN